MFIKDGLFVLLKCQEKAKEMGVNVSKKDETVGIISNINEAFLYL